MALFDFRKTDRLDKTAKTREDMYLRQMGKGTAVHYELKSCSTKLLEWVSTETDEQGDPLVVRVPMESTRECSRKLPFSMAGKKYSDLNSFLKKLDGAWGEDVYGRRVFCLKELYPCFDSYDYLYENRYYRWFLIREGNTISRLFLSDDRDKIYITDDVRNMESWVWTQMKESGFCQPPESKT